MRFPDERQVASDRKSEAERKLGKAQKAGDTGKYMILERTIAWLTQVIHLIDGVRDAQDKRKK